MKSVDFVAVMCIVVSKSGTSTYVDFYAPKHVTVEHFGSVVSEV